MDSDAIDDGATQFKCAPPIRDPDNRERLWDGLLGGEIDMIVSDHSPCTADLKRLDTGDFAAAWGGIASLELGLAVIWTEARARGRGLADVARWMATAPADRVGLPDKGRIAVGADADLVVFDPEAEFVVDPSRLQQRNPVSAYAGRRLAGVVAPDLAAGRAGRPIERRRSRQTDRERRARVTSYYVPRGGLPGQTELATDRTRFTEAYALLAKRTMRDIVTSYLPFWKDTRLWVIARPLSGFAETFSQYIVEVARGWWLGSPGIGPGRRSGAVRRRWHRRAHARGRRARP